MTRTIYFHFVLLSCSTKYYQRSYFLPTDLLLKVFFFFCFSIFCNFSLLFFFCFRYYKKRWNNGNQWSDCFWFGYDVLGKCSSRGTSFMYDDEVCDFILLLFLYFLGGEDSWKFFSSVAYWGDGFGEYEQN